MSNLTDLEVKNARPKARQYKLYDSTGLFILVAPSGGNVMRLSPDEARFVANQLSALVRCTHAID